MNTYHFLNWFFFGCVISALGTSAGFPQTYPELVQSGHPLVYWRFSNNLADSQGNLDLMSPGTPAFVDGPNSGHLAFSSNGGTAWAAQFGVEQLSGLYDFTYELWINLAGDNEGKVIFERQALTNGEPGSGTHRIRYGEGKLFFEYTGAGSVPETPAVELPNQTSGWHHIVLTSHYQNATNVLYVDGEAVFEGEAYLEPIFGGNQDVVYIGSSRSNPEGLIMDGYVDEVAIYNRALSAGEVVQHFQAALPDGYAGAVMASSPLVYWRFENNFHDEMNLYDLMPTGANYVEGPGGSPNTALFSRVLNNQAAILYDNIESFTYEMWINCIFESVQSYILFRRAGSAQHAVIYAYNPNALEFFFLEGGTRPLVTIPNQTDRWYHLAVVNDRHAGRMRIYLDGELALEHDGTAAPGPGNLVVVGGADLGANFNGYIDEVAMYDYALSGEQIQAHFRAPINGVPVADWSLF